jgi:hypothetical protein
MRDILSTRPSVFRTVIDTMPADERNAILENRDIIYPVIGVSLVGQPPIAAFTQPPPPPPQVVQVQVYNPPAQGQTYTPPAQPQGVQVQVYNPPAQNQPPQVQVYNPPPQAAAIPPEMAVLPEDTQQRLLELSASSGRSAADIMRLYKHCDGDVATIDMMIQMNVQIGP